MEHVLQESISKHTMDKQVTRNSQHGFTKGKIHLTNMIAHLNDTTAR